MSGRFVIRREKEELICLAGDGAKGELVELARVPFTKAPVREVRLYADPGGSDSGIDAQILNFRATAEEITGGTPESAIAIRAGAGGRCSASSSWAAAVATTGGGDELSPKGDQCSAR